MYIPLCIYIYTYIHTYIHTDMQICACVCEMIIYIYIYTHTRTCVHMYIPAQNKPSQVRHCKANLVYTCKLLVHILHFEPYANLLQRMGAPSCMRGIKRRASPPPGTRVLPPLYFVYKIRTVFLIPRIVYYLLMSLPPLFFAFKLRNFFDLLYN